MREPRPAYTYLLASAPYGVLYCGSTLDLMRRVHEHRTGLGAAFTRKYGVATLVWFETHALLNEAFIREQAIKRWRRAWKIILIEEPNPRWDDLYVELL
ncbi:MAG: GIY-YIG nuclease family protein [Hyphomonadaceae bacterium]|nr:GIY-YIG nuclease family protein [Hyphomonadaceae bacterium]